MINYLRVLLILVIFAGCVSAPRTVTMPEVVESPTKKEVALDYINKLKPRMALADAMDLAEHVVNLSDEHDVEIPVILAIAMQESSLRFQARNRQDFGMFQVNYYWHVKKAGLDLTREELNNNWKINAEIAVQYMAKCAKVKKPVNLPKWVCYHSFRNSHQHIYHKLVNRHLEKLK